MEVTPAGLRPIDELDAELVRTLGPTDEFELVETQHFVELLDGRNRRLAHPDDADLFGLDERDTAARHGVRQGRSRHPTGRAAAGDDDAGQFAVSVAHVWPVTCCSAGSRSAPWPDRRSRCCRNSCRTAARC